MEIKIAKKILKSNINTSFITHRCCFAFISDYYSTIIILLFVFHRLGLPDRIRGSSWLDVSNFWSEICKKRSKLKKNQGKLCLCRHLKYHVLSRHKLALFPFILSFLHSHSLIKQISHKISFVIYHKISMQSNNKFSVYANQGDSWYFD